MVMIIKSPGVWSRYVICQQIRILISILCSTILCAADSVQSGLNVFVEINDAIVGYMYSDKQCIAD